ncbi:MAG: hypothetical protein DKM50_11705 [Candidatus Margulisiibacteriota bacterium]|nr:MAG: hypothetical protein A2X43_02930 [Candidatus Margulisbacteria bacterium GWD2_39_127]OGI01212.1 MAG: hypothetical protein A2X42_06255 [Candidatus Margulisbacteria bacterium GWF2_38_17]OGI09847.1 MAG: hypothetical protein A2X41_09975 [Candidatus Margulisbacteria bacterium GWE2_39_32]PZM78437.1 MAG: hypothetical protein DKM50_11705 [Candidatus Margulisiibacteriota bacterium]HAR64151.1 hypothetical protein [Candidatus Margulisiibacteriota bacterium]
MNDEELAKLHTNQRLLVQELKNRGITVVIVDQEIELLKATWGNHIEWLLDRYTSINQYNITKMASDKILAKKLLKAADLSVPEGKVFNPNEIKPAINYANQLGYPVVVKPNWGSHGGCVFIDIKNEAALLSSIHEILSELGAIPFIIEKYFHGKEYRVFITKSGKYAVVHRDPAHVIGNGMLSIKELAERESNKRTNPRNTVHSPIIIDQVAIDYLSAQNRDLDYIPLLKEKIYLRNTTNVSMGGTCEDCTDIVHPSFIAIASKALKTMHGLPYAGIDILTKDASREQHHDSYTIVEINANPGFALHMKPGKGQPQNVAAYVADLIFPELTTGHA